MDFGSQANDLSSKYLFLVIFVFVFQTLLDQYSLSWKYRHMDNVVCIVCLYAVARAAILPHKSRQIEVACLRG